MHALNRNWKFKNKGHANILQLIGNKFEKASNGYEKCVQELKR